MARSALSEVVGKANVFSRTGFGWHALQALDPVGPLALVRSEIALPIPFLVPFAWPVEFSWWWWLLVLLSVLLVGKLPAQICKLFLHAGDFAALSVSA